MSGYDGNYFGKNDGYRLSMPFEIKICLVLIGIVFLLIFCTNSSMDEKWNDGICPDCEIRYEMGGVYKGLKYYYCPDCGNEVQKY